MFASPRGDPRMLKKDVETHAYNKLIRIIWKLIHYLLLILLIVKSRRRLLFPPASQINEILSIPTDLNFTA